MSKLTFNEEKHKYFLDDVFIPSVSEIIKPIYNKIYENANRYALKIASEKGTKVHRAIEFMTKYGLSKIDKDIIGYVQAYKKFRADNSSWKLLKSEFRTYNKALHYGMTIDEIYSINNEIVICDLKTTKAAHQEAWSVQLSAYKAGYDSQYPKEKISGIYVLQIFKDGNYLLHKLKDSFPIFLSCLEIYKFEV